MKNRTILDLCTLSSILFILLSLSSCTFSFGVAESPTPGPIARNTDKATQAAAMATIAAALTRQPLLETPTPDLTKTVVAEKATQQVAVEATLTAIALMITPTPTANVDATETTEAIKLAQAVRDFLTAQPTPTATDSHTPTNAPTTNVQATHTVERKKIETAVIATLAAVPVLTHAPAVTSTPSFYDDEFTTKLANKNWQWVNEGQWTVNPFYGQLRLIATRGDMAGACTNYKNLLLQEAPSGDFEIETEISIFPTANFQQGGLLIFTDANNYLKLDVGFSYSEHRKGVNVEFLLETDGQLPAPSESWPWRYLDSGNNVYLKIERSKDLSGQNFFVGKYRMNGKTWSTLGALSAPKITSPRIGVFALGGVVNSACVGDAPGTPVSFEYFRLRFK